jgi:hypothetical protein
MASPSCVSLIVRPHQSLVNECRVREAILTHLIGRERVVRLNAFSNAGAQNLINFSLVFSRV